MTGERVLEALTRDECLDLLAGQSFVPGEATATRAGSDGGRNGA